MVRKLIPLALLSIYGSAMAEEAKINLNLSPVVVTATRIEQNSFDLPVSIDVVEKKDLEGQLGMTLSESLIRVPGITAQNRTQMAQDPQISTRGFGARSTFGVRGIRVYVDQIPLSTPDGIATPGNIDIGALESIEVMRGPFSSLYGSSSGGVIQMRTQNAPKTPEIGGGVLTGSYDTKKEFGYATGAIQNLDYLINYSHFSTDGYRDRSDSKKEQATIKLKSQITEDTKVTMLFNWIDQKAKDPGGLTAEEVRADRKQSAGNNITQNARVSRDNQQLGINVEHKLNENNTINLVTYVGNRNNLQYLYSPAYTSSLGVSGRASAIERDFWGTDLRWSNAGKLFDKPYQLTAGMSYGYQKDNRTDDTANDGVMSVPPANDPLKYKLRDEKNISYNFDQYIQAQWSALNSLDLHGGIRHTDVTFKVEDSIVGTPNNTSLTYKYKDGSGKVSHQKTTPVIGAVWKITPTFNAYANFGKGFETPTFIEMAYSDTTGLGPNLGIKPSTSDNYEVGAKFFVADNTKVNLSVFKINTDNEIVSKAGTSAYSAFKNAGKTERKGLEITIDSRLPNNFNFYGAYTYLDAEFKSAFSNQYTAYVNGSPVTTVSNIYSGDKISGTYKDQLYAELSWKYPTLGFSTALEGRANSQVYANDSNTAHASGYTIYNLRAAFEQKLSNWRLVEYLRVENLTDKEYIGSVRNNDTSSKFYEVGAGRNYLVGVNASYMF